LVADDNDCRGCQSECVLTKFGLNKKSAHFKNEADTFKCVVALQKDEMIIEHAAF